MPMYEVQCAHCFKRDTIFRKMSEYNDLPKCEPCGKKMVRLISAVAVQTDIPHYISPATGKIINSRKDMREDLRVSRCIHPEPGIEKDIKRWGEESREKAFAPIAAGVDQVVTQLVAAGKIES